MLSTFYDFNHTFRSLDELAREVDRFFEGDTSKGYERTPQIDVVENEDAFVLTADAPGVAPEDITVTVEGEWVDLGFKRDMKPLEGYELRLRERSPFAFQRKFNIGAQLDATRADAKFENGVLTLTLPKAEAAKPRKIAVSAQ